MTVAYLYGQATRSAFNKEVDFDTDVVKVLLCDASYTPSQDTHRYLTDITNEITGGSYARQTLGSKTVAYDGPSNTYTMDGADPTFAGITAVNIRYAVFFIDTGTAATSPLLCYYDFESNSSPSFQDFKVTIHASGLIQAVVA